MHTETLSITPTSELEYSLGEHLSTPEGEALRQQMLVDFACTMKMFRDQAPRHPIARYYHDQIYQSHGLPPGTCQRIIEKEAVLEEIGLQGINFFMQFPDKSVAALARARLQRIVQELPTDLREIVAECADVSHDPASIDDILARCVLYRLSQGR